MEAIDRLEKLIEYRHLFSENISDWTVGMQIEHALRAHIGIIKLLRKSVPGEGKMVFNIKRQGVLILGRLPRGVAKAPKGVVPNQEVNEEQLLKLITLARIEHGETSSIDPAAWFKHALLGVMDKKTSLKFSEIHVKHHAIIAEEIKADNS